MEPKRLYRSKDNKMIFGICGGIGEYLNIDPVVIRVLYLITIWAGFPILLYFILLLVIPDRKN